MASDKASSSTSSTVEALSVCIRNAAVPNEKKELFRAENTLAHAKIPHRELLATILAHSWRSSRAWETGMGDEFL
eukprot:CAMPEP_0181176812 /NCGR_PEP_ID=MMETSP1096-20121128/4826_1 /TAXON_ID=156174 ORGANISM="Chrysochromulina ericina, Strain CCMP281" /NCGR_SAMPLE_ID=MMETSP1096 /ASSEMBLY_ACC=CAM_ASM_000453 /LENGTH=74 /DNA_ID=CAMNT_0023264919 /DNA_START=409 /DNA_END=633 /DNA_ORIENTATION=-